MRIRSVLIRNFRSIRELSFQPTSYTALIGANNSGKSNILRALEWFFSADKPQQTDFWTDGRDRADEVVVEVTFDRLSDLERQTFRSYILPDGSLKVRKTGTPDACQFRGFRLQPIFLVNGEVQRNDLRRRDVIRTLDEKYGIARYFPETGQITVSAVDEALAQIATERPDLCVEQLEDGNFMGERRIPAGLLGEFHLVPAVRDLRDETKVTNSTWFGKILGRLLEDLLETDMAALGVQEGLRELLSSLNRADDGTIPENRPPQLTELEETLTQLLRSWGATFELKIVPPDLDKIVQSGIEVWVDDGVKLPADVKGHGLQRAIIFGLIRAWSHLRPVRETTSVRERHRHRANLTIFAVEEPELYLHPHAQRRLYRDLRDMVEADANLYVMATTHSPVFVDMDKYRELTIVEKRKDGTKVIRCDRDLFEGANSQDRKRRFNMAYWFNPDRSEAFFAKGVILVEGQTEKATLPLLAERLGVYNEEVSIIDVGGKGNLPLYVEVLNAFRRPYVVVHDEDPVRVEPTHKDYERQLKQYRLNEEIRRVVDSRFGECYMLSPDFEGVAGLPKNSDSKALAAVEKFSRPESDIPPTLEEVVKRAFAVGDRETSDVAGAEDWRPAEWER